MTATHASVAPQVHTVKLACFLGDALAQLAIPQSIEGTTTAQPAQASAFGRGMIPGGPLR